MTEVEGLDRLRKEQGCARFRENFAADVPGDWLLYSGAEEMTVAWADQLAEETRKKHIRAGARVNSRVDLTVEWQEDGRTLQAPGYTVDISPKGCLAIVEQGLLVGQKVRLINGANGNTTGAHIIWKGHEGRKGWELGMELDGASGEFLGVEF